MSIFIGSTRIFTQSYKGLRHIEVWQYGDPVLVMPAASTSVRLPLFQPLSTTERTGDDSTPQTITIRNTQYTNLSSEVALDEDLDTYARFQCKQLTLQKEAKERKEELEKEVDLVMAVTMVLLPEVGVFKYLKWGLKIAGGWETILSSGVAELAAEEVIGWLAEEGFEKWLVKEGVTNVMRGGSRIAVGLAGEGSALIFKSMDVFGGAGLLPAEEILLEIHRFKYMVDPVYRKGCDTVTEEQKEFLVERYQQRLSQAAH